MERPFTQREWHHIPFSSLPPAGPAADRAFYGTFYRTLLAGGGSPVDAAWIAQKQRMGSWLLDEFLTAAPPDRCRVLSIGAGLGVAETEIAARGFAVDVVEVEPASIKYAAERCRRLTPIVGDARALPLGADLYDLAIVAGVDYVFPRDEYARVLAELSRVVTLQGRIVVICLSNLSLPDVLRALRPRRAASRQRGELAWGYQRTAGEHIAAARRAGLRTDRVFHLDAGFRAITVRSGRSWLAPAPTWSSGTVAVAFSRS